MVLNATFLVLDKKPISIIVNARKLPIITTYTDTINYYNIVAYIFPFLYIQYFRAEITYLPVLLRATHSIKLFLHI